MSLNINQIATAAVSILPTDKLYLGRSPFGLTDDRYILGSSIISQFAPAPGLIPVNQTTATRAMLINNRYVTNNGAVLVTYTLPSLATVGEETEIIGFSTGLWTIAQAAGQQILFGNQLTTLGVGGSISATDRADCIRLICVVANTTYVIASVIGNPTVV